MNILICITGEIGGTDLLLKKYNDWLNMNGECAKCVIIRDEWQQLKHLSFDLLVLPTSQISNLIFLKIGKVKFNKILIWVMGTGAYKGAYYNYHNVGSHFPEKLYSKLMDFISTISIKHFIRLNSCIFTDEVGLNIELNGAPVKVDNLIFPVPIKFIGEGYRKDDEISTLRFCWLGRVSTDFKLYSLIQVIDDVQKNIENGRINKKVVFTIIGDGNGMYMLEERIRKNHNVEFKLISHIPYNELDVVLAENADFLFAMGTSALDGAKIGCPTVIVQPLTQRTYGSDKVYRWIFESKGYSTGEFFTNVKPEQVKKSFNQIYNDILYDKELSNKCLDYARDFDEGIVFTNLKKRKLPNNLTPISYLFIFINFVIKETKSLIKHILYKVGFW